VLRYTPTTIVNKHFYRRQTNLLFLHTFHTYNLGYEKEIFVHNIQQGMYLSTTGDIVMCMICVLAILFILIFRL